MAFPLSTGSATLSIVLMTTFLTSSVLCGGIDGQVAKCRQCWSSIGRAFNGLADRLDTQDSDLEAVLQAHRPRSELLSLLLTGKGRQSLHDDDCSACWVVFLKLTSQAHRGSRPRLHDSGDDDTFQSYDKRVMLNNGWV